jgi:nucleoside phosphorylase
LKVRDFLVHPIAQFAHDFIAHIEQNRHNRGSFSAQSHMSRAVILTALPIEYSAVCHHLADLREETLPQGTIYGRGTFTANGQCWDVGVAEVGKGNAGAAVEAERAIAHFQPDILFFVGIAGGIKDVVIGDVVVATKVYGYESGKVEDQFFTRPEVEKSSYALVQRAKQEAKGSDWLTRLRSNSAPNPNIWLGPIAAGEKVIAAKDSETFRLLRSHYNDAIAVEMEDFGFLSAVRGHKQVDAIVIRGISDLIDGKGKADREGSPKIAAGHASAFAFQMLSKLKFSPESDHRLAGVCQSPDQRLESQSPALGSKPAQLPSPDQLRLAR